MAYGASFDGAVSRNFQQLRVRRVSAPIDLCVGPIEKLERKIAVGDGRAADPLIQAGGRKLFRAVLQHEIEPRAVFAKAQLHDFRRIREGVANHWTGLGDAKGDDGGVGTQLPLQVELLLGLLEAYLVEDFPGRRRRVGSNRHRREEDPDEERGRFMHER